jgi:membrane protease YdiL (CAAX protease family)
VVIATIVMMRIGRRTPSDYYIQVRGLLGKNFWIGVLWGIAAVSLLIELIALAGGYRIAGVALHEHVAYWVLIWLVASASIGIVEEIAFRGYMLRTCYPIAQDQPLRIEEGSFIRQVQQPR